MSKCCVSGIDLNYGLYRKIAGEKVVGWPMHEYESIDDDGI
jgi:hypothetical protein